MSPIRARVTVCLALVAVLSAACGVASAPPPGVTAAPAPSIAPPSPTTTTPSPTTTAPPSPSRAQAAVAATAAAGDERSDVTLGVAVLDRATGRTATNDAGDTPLRSASVAKLFTIVDILTRRANGAVSTTDGDVQQIRRALSASDDNAMNALWSRFGGSAGVQRVSTLVGLSETSPPSDDSQWGEVETSPRDVAAVYGFITTRLAPADRDLMISSLSAATPTAADGFDQAYGLLDPDRRGAAVAKQGWLCCLDSSVDLHSTGLLDPAGRYVLVLMSNQPFGYAAARRLLDDAASAARDALGTA